MPNIVPYDERHLLVLIAQGDEKAFSQLFHTYHQQLGDYMLAITQSRELTEEIVQETFVKVWMQRATLTTVTNFRSWLFTICRNHAFNTLRNLARERLRKQAWSSVAGNDATEEPDREPFFQLVEKAIMQLPPQQRKVYLLSRYKGLKQQEIARELLLSRETVKRHISLSMRAIISYIRKHTKEAFFFLVYWIEYAT